MAKLINMNDDIFKPLSVGELIMALSAYPRDMRVKLHVGNDLYRDLAEQDLDMVDSDDGIEGVCVNILNAYKENEAHPAEDIDLLTDVDNANVTLEYLAAFVSDFYPKQGDHLINSLGGLTAFNELKTKVLKGLCEACDGLKLFEELVKYDKQKEKELANALKSEIDKIEKQEPTVSVNKDGDIIGLENGLGDSDPRGAA